MPEFPVDGPITVAFKIMSGSVDVVAEERTSAYVEVTAGDRRGESQRLADETTVDLQGDTLSIVTPNQNGFRLRGGSVAIRVHVPLDSAVNGKSASADVTFRGRLGGVQVDAASGDIKADHIGGDATITTASGDVRLAQVEGHLRAKSASGDLRAQQIAGAFTGKYASGDVQVEEVGGDISVESASGDVTIRKAQRGTARISTASGDVHIGIQPGTGVWFDVQTMSGTTRNGLDMSTPGPETDNASGNQISLQLRTMSGDINIQRA